MEGLATTNYIIHHPQHPLQLKCSVIGYPNITYIWSCDQCGDNQTVELSAGSRNDGDNETVTCTASVHRMFSPNLYN